MGCVGSFEQGRNHRPSAFPLMELQQALWDVIDVVIIILPARF